MKGTMNKKRMVVGLLAASLAATAHAQESTIPQRLDELEQEIRILKRRRELEQESVQQKVKETPIVTAGKDGFALKSPDGNFVLNLKGLVQADSRWYLDDQDHNGVDTFLIRRARPILEGTLFKDFDFRLMPDFAGSSATLFDAYVEWKHWQALKLRIGKFKSPAGLGQLEEGIFTSFTQ